MPKIGLCMIVKNEAHTIEKCLRSVHRLIDYVLIEDTGSTDDTQLIIRRYLARENMPGEVFDEPWQDFATNRSIGLARLRLNKDIDYALIMDADDVLLFDAEFDPAAFKAAMDKDVYDVNIRLGDVYYNRPQILNNRRKFGYRGVLHEFVDFPQGPCSRELAPGLLIDCGTQGARSRNPQKYQDDSRVLERALAAETDPLLRSRYTYYLAQSYRDAGNLESALAYFLHRSTLGYWTEEIYVSLLSAARLMQRLDYPADDVIAAFENAAAINPARAEALHGAAKLCNQTGRSGQAYQFAKRGLGLTPPKDGLFVEATVYAYGMPDEFSVAAYWAGEYAASLDACVTLLGSTALPEPERLRVSANARFALDKLPKAKSLGRLGMEDFTVQHLLQPDRKLRPGLDGHKKVLIAILAKQAEVALPLYLQCIEALDYPKSAITLYIRTNNNTDETEPLLRQWVERVRPSYAFIEYDSTDLPVPVQQYGVHEWTPQRFAVMGQLRNTCLQKTLDHRCDFMFVADVDNFVRPSTLRHLVAANLPIVAPLLRSVETRDMYSNFFAETTGNGYFEEVDQYHWALQRRVRGLIEMPLVHCTYLVRADVIPELSYIDGSDRYEFVIFSDSARRAAVPQYLDNRQIYGYIGRNDIERHAALAGEYLSGELDGPYFDQLQPNAVTHLVGD